jgi:hypothetical protein
MPIHQVIISDPSLRSEAYQNPFFWLSDCSTKIIVFVCTPAYLLIIIIAGTLDNLFDLSSSVTVRTYLVCFSPTRLESRTRYLLILEVNRVYTNLQRTTIHHPVIQSRDLNTRISALGVYYYIRDDSPSICQHGIGIDLIPRSAHRASSTISKRSARRAWLHSDKHDGFQSPIAGFWRSHIPTFFNIDNTIRHTPSQRVNATTARPVFAGISRVGQKLTTIEVWILVLWSSRYTLTQTQKLRVCEVSYLKHRIFVFRRYFDPLPISFIVIGHLSNP